MKSYWQKILATTVFLCVSCIANAGNLASQLADEIKNSNAKLIYLDFWASWCGPCKASFPWMQKLHSELSSQGLKIIAVNLDSDSDKAKQFLKRYGVDFKIIYDSEGVLAQEYKVAGMPHSFILNAKGEVLYSHVSFTLKEADDLRAKIVNFLKEQS